MKKRLEILFIAMLVFTLVLAGCSNSSNKKDEATGAPASNSSNENETGSPIASKPVTLKIVSPKAPLSPDYGEMEIFKRLESATNVHIEWNNIPDTNYQEKKNLLLASNDLPDAFYNAGFSDFDLLKYGTDGSIIPLETLIDNYMPNVKKLIERRPELKSFITAPDGHIYSLPIGEELGSGQGGIGSDPFFTFINKKWLDGLGLQVPTTLDELHTVLTAFKDKDPNGNGAKDENPFSFINNWWCADIGNYFGSFGMPDNLDHMIVKDGKIIFTAAEPQYKEAVSYFHNWVQEGLIDKESLTQDTKALFAKGKTADVTLGSFVWWEETEIVGTAREKDYVLVPPLKGPHGDISVGYSNGSPWGRGAFVITKASKDPSIIAKWIDLQYEPKMAAQIHWGPIGVIYKEDASGKLVNLPLPDGVAMGEYRQKVAPNGAGVILGEDFGKIVDMEARAKVRIDRINETFVPHMLKEHVPTIFFQPEELDKLNQIKTDLIDYVNKQRAKWLMEGGIDKEWEGYLANLKKIGLDEYIKIYQNGLDRYNKK